MHSAAKPANFVTSQGSVSQCSQFPPKSLQRYRSPIYAGAAHSETEYGPSNPIKMKFSGWMILTELSARAGWLPSGSENSHIVKPNSAVSPQLAFQLLFQPVRLIFIRAVYDPPSGTWTPPSHVIVPQIPESSSYFLPRSIPCRLFHQQRRQMRWACGKATEFQSRVLSVVGESKRYDWTSYKHNNQSICCSILIK